jgi:predicted aspartyl protease
MKIPYLSDYNPPIPVAQIWLGYPDESLNSGPFEAIIDIGADGTILPHFIIDELDPPFVDNAWLSSQWGETFAVKIFEVDMGIAGFRLPSVQVVADERSDEIILGRNVLNCLRLMLDGPQQETELFER